MKKYTKKQITEAIAYWEKQLNESYDFGMQDVKAISAEDLKKEIESMDVKIFQQNGKVIAKIPNIDISVSDSKTICEWLQITIDYIQKFNKTIPADIDIEKVDCLNTSFGTDLYVSSSNLIELQRFVYGYLYLKEI